MAAPQKKSIRSWFRFKFRTMMIAVTVLAIAIGLLARQYAACQRETAVAEELRLMGTTVTPAPKSNFIWDQKFCGTFALPAYKVELKFENLEAQLDLLRQLRHVHHLKGVPRKDDLSQFAFLTELRSLEFYCWYTKTLKGIEGMKRLEVLSLLDSDAIKNLKPLKGLENLNTIHTTWEDAGYLSVSSEVIASLKGLQHLELRGCELESASAFSNLKHLETIEIDYTPKPITGLENLVGVPSLRRIGLTNVSTLENLDCFAQMPNLESIFLWNTDSLKNVEGIADLKKLKVLYLVNCHPDIDLAPLKRLKTLTRKEVSVMSKE